MKKAFILVGHSNWGKSTTLKCLTENSRYIKSIKIADITFFIRRMSNDDNGESLLKFVRDTNEQNIIMTLCPNFQEGQLTIEILEELRKKYQLFFFVLEYKYDQSQKILQEEIDKLNTYSDVIEMFSEKNSPSDLKTEKFHKFIEKYC